MTRPLSLRQLMYTGLLLTSSAGVLAQQRPAKNGKAPVAPTQAPAAMQQPPAAPPKPGPKPYKEVVGKAKTEKGLLLVHKVDDRYLFEIPESLINRDILVMTRVARSGTDLRSSTSMAGYAGDEVNSNVISFERGPNNKLFLLKKSFSEFSSDSTREMYMAVTRSNMQPISAAFDIKSNASDSNGVVVDFTEFINGDNDILHFDPNERKGWSIGQMMADKSYITEIKSFPLNTNIKAVKTYSRAASNNPLAAMMGMSAPTGNVTLELTTSFVVLPKVPMKPRYFDPRVGYFAVGYTDFDKNPQGVKKLTIAKRWRLEPKPEDVERYKKGELVEPANPIVIYIDPATPSKWVPYLIQGVNDWQVAFEKAGFKNAIVAKKAPTPQEDPSWSMDDARNSVIVYKPSSVANASGPSTADPRSGEIIETHINWYHNVMELLRNWYMVQTAAVDPRARSMEFSDELMGQLIRFVSSHEVGHTLGLRHNFGSSSTVPVEKLRDKKWVEEHGHTPSIMDYARFNYVAQPEDGISEKGIFPRIGDYDTWAIEWGYKWTDKTVEVETAMLNQLTTEKAKNPRNWFGTEMNPNDPRSQSEDLGDNAMLASTYGVKNLQRIVPQLPKWTATPAEGYRDLATMYSQVTSQFARYIGHVAKNLGGMMETPKMMEQSGGIYERVSKARQKEAMDWLSKNVLTTPTWLFNKEITEKCGVDQISMVGKYQDMVLDKCLSSGTLDKLTAGEAEAGAAAYSASDLLSDLRNAVFTELKTNKATDVYRRNLQKSYVSRLGKILNPPPAASSGQQMGGMNVMMAGGGGANDKTDAFSLLKANAKSLRNEIKAALPATTDKMTRYHYEDLVERLNNMLNPK